MDWLGDPVCDHPVYCNNTLLTIFQGAGIFNDSKTFVDSPMRFDLNVTLFRLNQWLSPWHLDEGPHREEVWEIYNQLFSKPGDDLVVVDGLEFEDEPRGRSIPLQLRDWADDLDHTWNLLARKVKIRKDCHECSSLIPVPYPFIVPGGRFTENYYWDCYWISKGLLASGMASTVKNNMRNFAYLVDRFGFVPNGNRVYYANRSQPPLMTQMLSDYYEFTGDLEFLEEMLPYVCKEYDFWMEFRTVDLDGGQLNVYRTKVSSPRPESFTEDLELSRRLPSRQRAVEFFSEIAAAAESGFDFSSRWIRNMGSDLTAIETSRIVPVDLNCIMYKNEVTISNLASLLQYNRAEGFRRAADRRRWLMARYLFNTTIDVWSDYNYVTGEHSIRDENSHSLVSLFPFWADSIHESIPVDRLVSLLKRISTVLTKSFSGGAPTNLIFTGQQWDFPNSWPPLQWILVEGFLNFARVEGVDSKWSIDIAQKHVDNWIQNCYCGWKESETRGKSYFKKDNNKGEYVKRSKLSNLPWPAGMFEKYDARFVGRPGFGGEYFVQEGFGWTNGVVLDWISRFSKSDSSIHLKDPDLCASKEEASPPIELSFTPLVFLLLIYSVWKISTTISGWYYRMNQCNGYQGVENGGKEEEMVLQGTTAPKPN